MNGAAFPGLPGPPQAFGGSFGIGPSPTGLPLPGTQPLQPQVQDPEPLPEIEDSILLQIMQSTYERSKSARETRARLNRRNWDALHGKFDFLAKKRPGQSQIVIPSLETSLEQVCAQLTEQLVGFQNWFTASYDGDVPPLPGLKADEAARILGIELERLAVDSGCMPTTYGIKRLVYDSLKLGLIESEITWKVSMVPEENAQYQMLNGEMVVGATESMRLRVDLIPFEDFYPDPSAAKAYMIHEMAVPIADLPDLGFTKEQIDQMRHSAPGTEKLEQQRRRSGIAHAMPAPIHQVLLREYWGDLVHPQTGDLLARAATFMTASNTTVVKPPERIRALLWGGKRPFIHTPLLPTPTSEQHHAFLDIAVPLIEAECELFNLLVDAGFSAAFGIKQIRSYMLRDPGVIAKGLSPAMELDILEGQPETPVVEKVDTGTLTPDMLQIYDRIARTRQEATRTNDLQLGRQAIRKTSATEINEISESSDDLFSNMALRFEDNHEEPGLELIWQTLWQFADQSMIQRIGSVLKDETHGQTLALLTPEERFVAFAGAVSFKARGYKFQLQSTKDIQTVMQLQQMAMQNPALAQVLQQYISPIKFVEMVLRSRGLDPDQLRPDPDEPQMDPALMQGQAGNPQQSNPNMSPAAGAQEQQNPPNPMGQRGIQQP